MNDCATKSLTAWLLASSLMHISCQQEDVNHSGRYTPPKTKTETKNVPVRGGEKTGGEEDPLTDVVYGTNNDFGDGGEIPTSDNPMPEASKQPEPPLPLTYPELEYTAFGLMFHSRQNDPYKLMRKIIFKPSKDALDISLIAFSSSDNNLKNKLEEKVGGTHFVRATADEIKALKNTDGTAREPLDFAIYAKSIATTLADKTLNRFEFETPIPVYIVPGAASRYDVLKNGPITFNTKVTGKLGKTNATALTTKAFNLRIAFSLSTDAVGADQTKINMTVSIPEDDSSTAGDAQGALYGIFPMDKKSNFLVDTKNRKMTEIKTSGDFNDENRRQRMDFTYSICKENVDGKATNFTCPTAYPK